jgi:hypothetical protein
VLLGHEFGVIQTSELAEFVDPYYRRPHLGSVLAALAARAPRPSLVTAVRDETLPYVIPASLDDVADASCDGDDLAEDLCHVVARTLYRDLDTIHFEQLATRSARLRLIAAVLQYVHGLEIEPTWILKIVASGVLQLRHDKSCYMQFWRLANQAFRQLVRKHPDRTRALLGAEIERGGPECLRAGMLAASAGWTLSSAELAVLLTSYSEYPYSNSRPLLRFLMAETLHALDCGLVDDVLRRAISQSLERLILAKGYVSERDPLALVGYALLAWLLGSESDEAPVAFRQGLVTLSSGDRSQGGFDVLAEAVELLKRVDPQRMREALTNYQEDEPTIVAVALLLSSFINPRANFDALSAAKCVL